MLLRLCILLLSLSFFIIEPAAMILTTSPVSPQPPGKLIYIVGTPAAADAETKFWLLHNGVWSVLAEWSSGRVISYTPQTEGVYEFAAWARPPDSTADVYYNIFDHSNRVIFTAAWPEPTVMIMTPPPVGECQITQLSINMRVPESDATGFGGVGKFSQGQQYTPLGYPLPVIVPAGHYFGVVSVRFASKYLASAGRSSYMVIRGIDTIPEHAPNWTSMVPLVLPPGHLIDGAFLNNSNEAQNMNAVVLGYLSSDREFRNCR